MAIGETGSYRLMIDQAHEDFLRDVITLTVVQKVEGGYYPVTITIERGDTIYTSDTAYDVELPKSKIPTELCDLLLQSLARYLMGDGSDLIVKLRKAEAERNLAVKQLNDLIAGIGRLGNGKTD